MQNDLKNRLIKKPIPLNQVELIIRNLTIETEILREVKEIETRKEVKEIEINKDIKIIEIMIIDRIEIEKIIEIMNEIENIIEKKINLIKILIYKIIY